VSVGLKYGKKYISSSSGHEAGLTNGLPRPHGCIHLVVFLMVIQDLLLLGRQLWSCIGYLLSSTTLT